MTELVKIQEELNLQLSNKEIVSSLVSTTFKGLNEESMRKAALEGMMRGFKFEDFLKKNVYALSYGSSYSLVTSIDYSRKIGMRSGVVGKSEPIYEEKDGKIVSCSITIKRKVGSDIGEFTAKVYFDEYTTGKNLWISKPRTMIAKVAEMHALRMACPEELSQAYVEEEITIGEAVAKDTKNNLAKPTNIKVHIMSQLRMLGTDIKDKEVVKKAIKDLTGLDPSTDHQGDLQDISDRLAILIGEKYAGN